MNLPDFNRQSLQEAGYGFFTKELGFSVKSFTAKSFTARQLFGQSYKESNAFQLVEEGAVIGIVDDRSLKRPEQNQPDL